MIIEFDQTADDVRAHIKAATLWNLRKPGIRRMRRVWSFSNAIIVAAALVLCLVVVANAHRLPRTDLYLASLSAGAFLFIAWGRAVLVWSSRLQARTLCGYTIRFIDNTPAGDVGPRKIELTDSGFRLEAPGAVCVYEWPTIEAVERQATGVHVFPRGRTRQGWLVPARAFSTPEACEAFATQAGMHLTRRV